MFRLATRKLFSSIKAPIQAIKKLREQTSAPISQCKTALQQNNLSHQAALKWLKQKGLAQAQKRLNKQTRQGVIGAMVTQCRSKVVLVQVNCETDFVAKNSLFINFVHSVMSRAIQAQYLLPYDLSNTQKQGGIQAFLQNCKSTQLFPQDKSIQTLNQQYKIIISRLQQNIRIRRIITLHSDKYKYGVYVHQGYDQFVGLQASVTQFTVDPQLDENNHQEVEEFGEFADNIATQVLGSSAKYLREDLIPKQMIQQQTQKAKKVLAQRLTKAPAHTHQKMIKGKVNVDFYQNNLLPKMNYILSNDGIPVQQYWKQVQSSLNKKIQINNAFVWGCKE